MAEETGKFEVVILISPKRESQRKLPKYLAHLNYSFPVFIDEKNMFLEGNKFLPNSNRYHTMLTNGAGYPIFVGNPSWSESLNELFITIINNQL